MRFFFLLFFLHTLYFASSQESDYQAVFIDKKLTENANAIARLDEMAITVASHKKLSYSVRQVVTVLNKNGDKYAKTHVFYDGEKTISKLEAYVYDKLGHKVQHIKRKDFQDKNAADGFSLYRDDRILQYRFTPTQYPYTLELSYEVETSDTGVFPSWYFISGSHLSVEKSRFSISYASKDIKPIVAEFNITGFPIVKEETSGNISFKADNLSAVEMENLAPNFYDITPRLAVRMPSFHYKGYDAKANNWKELGAWIDGSLLEGRTELHEATKAQVRAMVTGIEDKLEKAKIIYKYVQENTRYISVQIGIGGFRPINAIDVDRVKYGDCKGLSNYTMALLKAVNVPSYYTVVEAGNRKVDFEDDFADLRQGNHAILAIPYKGSYYWIDCTSQIHPFGFLGDFTDDRKVLVIKPEGGEIIKTVAYLDNQNYRNTKASYQLSEDGSIKGSLVMTTKGIPYDNRFFIKAYSDDELVKYYRGYWSYINNLQIGSKSFDDDRENIIFKENLELSASSYGSKSGERIFFTINAFNRTTTIPTRYRNRKYPFEIQRGHFDEDEFLIQLPMGYSVENLPEKTLIESAFGRYSSEFSYDNHKQTILYKRNFQVKHGKYPKEQYASYRDFRKKVATADAAQLVLVKQESK